MKYRGCERERPLYMTMTVVTNGPRTITVVMLEGMCELYSHVCVCSYCLVNIIYKSENIPSASMKASVCE